MLDVHQLNVFVVAAEALNFTQAAQQLHMTQPSVSQHIQGLERHFDTQLFFRNGRNLELTDAGMALLPLAKEAVMLSMQIDETMISLKGGIFGHLIVACSTTPGKYILPHLLTSFHHRHPQVRVTCQVTPQTDALQSLVDGEVHFALFSMDYANYPDIEAVSFICDPIILIAPLDHPWAQRDQIEAEDLLDADFIMRESSSGTFHAVTEALKQHKVSVSDLRTLITLGNSEAIALSVQEGLGVGFISQMVIDRICPGKVARIPVRDLNICRNIYIGHNSRRPESKSQAAFWAFLTSEMTDPLTVSS